ncbi:MAG: hypothetical protein ACMG57_00410 [Candidatus Dojkabacteria bacterium]
MLHKIIDFTQTILGTVALTGIIAFSVITVNALNPSIKSTTSEPPQVAGLSTLPQENNSLSLQFTDALKNNEVKGNLSYVSDKKSTYKLEVTDLTQVKELDFLNVENLNHFQSGFNIVMFVPQGVVEKINIELMDNIDNYELSQKSITLNLTSIQQKALKLKLTPNVNINFPFELVFEITQ